MFTTTTRDEAGGRLLHVLNVSGYRPDVRIVLDDGEVDLRPAPHSGYLLARGIVLGGVRVLTADAELTAIADGDLTFGRLAGETARIVLETEAAVSADGPGARVGTAPGRAVVTADGPVRVRVG